MGFYEKTYNIVKLIPKGKVATYGQIASLIGEAGKARIVGWALHKNPYQGIVPCHRVVGKNGALGSGFAFGSLKTQIKMLEDEGIKFNENGRIELKEYLWKPENFFYAQSFNM